MEPKKITVQKIDEILADLKNNPEMAIGTYLYKGLRVQISQYKASGSERFARLYHNRRDNGLCVVCGSKVKLKNPRTKKLYRLCEAHRDKIDKKS